MSVISRKKHMKKGFLFFSTLVAISSTPLISLVGCKQNKIYVTDIKITNKPTNSILVGDTLDLNATLTPISPTDGSITWSSSSESIIKVNSETGAIEAVGVGEATITATANGSNPTADVVTDSVTITVKPKVYVTNIEITNKPTNPIAVGDTLDLNATLTPISPTDGSITWSSSSESIIKVNSETGAIEAVDVGEATITATANGSDPTTPAVTDSVTITVEKAKVYVTDIKITNKPTDPIAFGDTFILNTKLTPESPTDDSVSWKSDKESIIKVNSETGAIEAVGIGKATITATANGSNPTTAAVTDSVTITVEKATMFVVNEDGTTLPTLLDEESKGKIKCINRAGAKIQDVDWELLSGVDGCITFTKDATGSWEYEVISRHTVATYNIVITFKSEEYIDYNWRFTIQYQ